MANYLNAIQLLGTSTLLAPRSLRPNRLIVNFPKMYGHLKSGNKYIECQCGALLLLPVRVIQTTGLKLKLIAVYSDILYNPILDIPIGRHDRTD